MSKEARLIKQAAFEALTQSYGGAVGFFTVMAQEQPVAFMGFLKTLMPKAIDLEDMDGKVQINLIQFTPNKEINDGML